MATRIDPIFDWENGIGFNYETGMKAGWNGKKYRMGCVVFKPLFGTTEYSIVCASGASFPGPSLRHCLAPAGGLIALSDYQLFKAITSSHYITCLQYG